jgi:hypothetical protein
MTASSRQPKEPLQDASSHASGIEARLVRLGAESHTERTVKRIVPWIASLLVHLALIAAGFLITWTVVSRMQDEEPELIVADFYANQYQAVTAATPAPDAVSTPVAPAAPAIASPALDQRMIEQLTAPGPGDQLGKLADAASRSGLSDFAPQTTGQARFIGLRATNARKIVYVIDASGSMIRMLPIVIDELNKSLERLSPKQSFAIVFFQRNEALLVPPINRLTPADPDARRAALAWIKSNVIPSGRSNPLKAIESALRLQPDAIFMLSENITGSGEFEIDQRDLLERLEQLNPIDPRTGRRRTQINCIQFLSIDPIDTLRKIADTHGGPNGYKYLDRSELGLGQ